MLESIEQEIQKKVFLISILMKSICFSANLLGGIRQAFPNLKSLSSLLREFEPTLDFGEGACFGPPGWPAPRVSPACLGLGPGK